MKEWLFLADSSRSVWKIETNLIESLEMKAYSFLMLSVAAEVYSVDSIPDNLLINPEGIVVARGLRGEALAKKLAEAFN